MWAGLITLTTCSHSFSLKTAQSAFKTNNCWTINSWKAHILQKQAFNLISNMWHVVTWLLESPCQCVGGMGLALPMTPSVRLSVCTSANLHQHPTAHWSQFAGGRGALGDQRLTGRGCKPQTNYTPSPNTAGRRTRKNILLHRVFAGQENMIHSAESDPPFPSLRVEF